MENRRCTLANDLSWFSILFAASTVQFCISTVMDSEDLFTDVVPTRVVADSASGCSIIWSEQETRDLVSFFYEHHGEWTGSGWKNPTINACINHLHARHPNITRTTNAVTKKFQSVSISFAMIL